MSTPPLGYGFTWCPTPRFSSPLPPNNYWYACTHSCEPNALRWPSSVITSRPHVLWNRPTNWNILARCEQTVKNLYWNRCIKITLTATWFLWYLGSQVSLRSLLSIEVDMARIKRKDLQRAIGNNNVFLW